MNEKMIRKYARMLATVGINVQKGQKVLVEACIEGYSFANIFAQECYEVGASEVIINYLDLPFLKTKAIYQGNDVSKIDAIILLVLFCGFIGYTLYIAKKGASEETEETSEPVEETEKEDGGGICISHRIITTGTRQRTYSARQLLAGCFFG